MQRDWSSAAHEAPERKTLRRAVTYGSLVVSALGLLYVGIWLGERRRAPAVNSSALTRPMTLGEARFAWRGRALKRLPHQPSILPPVEDPMIPNRAPPVSPDDQARSSMLTPPEPAQVKLSLTDSLEHDPVDHNAEKREQAEREQAEREQAEREQAEREQAEREQAEREQAKREQAEREQAEREQAEREQAERERAEREQAEREQAEREQAEREQATPKRAQVTTLSASQTAGRFNLQIKAFRKRAEAIKFVRKLSAKLVEYKDQLYIQSAESRGQPIYRVRVGPFSTEAQAEQSRLVYIKRFGTVDAPFVSHR